MNDIKSYLESEFIPSQQSTIVKSINGLVDKWEEQLNNADN